MPWKYIYLKNNRNLCSTYYEIKRLAIKEKKYYSSFLKIAIWYLLGYDPDAEVQAWLTKENKSMIRASEIFNYWDSLKSRTNKNGKS
ncbi:MAG: hypothetical protein R2685_07975 [Candidatus Nitrosocosmicus sp.]|nr:hypothetical protein [Candidatus Nitrosocosmicus sp.]